MAITGLSAPSTSVKLYAEYGPSTVDFPATAWEWISFAPSGDTVTYTPPGGTATTDPVVSATLGEGGWTTDLTLSAPVANGGMLQMVAPGTNPSPTLAGQFPTPVTNEIIVAIDPTIGIGNDPVTNAVGFTAPAATAQEASNWSGYALDNGPFSAITGSFEVPYLTTDATCNEVTSEWVGIDGLNDNSLIQAGVSESMTNPDTGECEAGYFYSWAWWEVLPSVATSIATWDSGSPAVVNAGDSVTVSISATGSISLTDTLAGTTNGTFTTQQSYSGPATSAEWVIEAPDDPTFCGGTCTLAPYSDEAEGWPGTLFDLLGVTGNESDLYPITMVQGGEAVSTPSPLGEPLLRTFDVAYTGTLESPINATVEPLKGVGVTGRNPLYPAFG